MVKTGIIVFMAILFVGGEKVDRKRKGVRRIPCYLLCVAFSLSPLL